MMKTSIGIKNFGVRAVVNFAFVVCAAMIFGGAAQAAIITVTSDADSGGGTLRAAIAQANASVGVADEIRFAIPGGGNRSINLLSPLPTITDPVLIDGYTQTGAAVNTAATGFNGTVNLTLNGAGAGDTAIGLRIAASNTTVRGFYIIRFSEAGIRIDTGGGNTVTGNLIGTDLTGNGSQCGAAPTVSCGNVNRGILIVGGTAANNIGDGTLAGRNVVSNNQGRGIEITAGGSARIRGNYIGTASNGTGDLGNFSHGIQIVNSSNSVIGGATATERNVVSGNNGSGIFIVGDIGTPAANNVVTGNFVGVNANGNTALANNGSGVVVQDANNVIGGTTVAERNIISGNNFNGVTVAGSLAIGNVVRGNLIGVGLDGTTSIPNRESGVQISNQASGNTVGSLSVPGGSCVNGCNIIANNGAVDSTSARAGIYLDITAGTNNAFLRNSIYNNTGIGIDLGVPGATANDAGDPDTGANNLQNFPIITAADTRGNIRGTLNSLASTMFAVDFYVNSAAGTDEARLYIGTSVVTTDASGNATFDVGISSPTLAVGQAVTATATKLSPSPGETSELAAAQNVVTATGTAPAGIECDSAPRPSGSGGYTAADPQQVERFLVFADSFDRPENEFQRADCAPYASRGDGRMTSADVQQAERYLASADAMQSAGGPTMSGGRIASEKSPDGLFEEKDLQNVSLSETTRVVRAGNVNTSAGRTITVPILVDTDGTETGFSFTFDYDSTILTNPVILDGDLGGTRVTKINRQGNANKITFSLRNFTGANGTIAAANDGVIVRVQFTVNAAAQPGTTNLSFSGSLTANSATNYSAQELPARFNPGTVTISGPTAAPALVAGRVTNASGVGLANVLVNLLDAESGARLSVVTDGEGGYRFEDVPVGGNYIVSPSSVGFTFNPRSKIFSLVEDLTTVDFVGTRNRKRKF